MNNIKNVVSPEYMAKHYHNKGLGHESNPYSKDIEWDKYEKFYMEMGKLQLNEFNEMMGATA